MKRPSYVLFDAGPAVIVESDLTPAERAQWRAVADDHDEQAAFDEIEEGGRQESGIASQWNSVPSLPPAA